MTKINPSFNNELKKYGAFDYNACYNCGTCTATCSLSTPDNSFPREMVRYSTLGLEDDMKSSLKPWLCYYCGECSTNCPRQANPGELMMSLRRWLTAKYDWTGFSGLIYKSTLISSILFILTALGVILFSWKQNFELDAIMTFGHYFEMIAIASVFAIILLPNIIRMWWYTLGRNNKFTFKPYFQSAGELFVHMFTQKRYLGCDDSQTRWFEHLILVIGYLTLLFTSVAFDWMGTDNTTIIVIGYVECAIVFGVTFDFMRRRVKKDSEVSSNSQPSDWLFVVWLFLLGFTSFIVRLLVDLNVIEHNLWLVIFHFIILVQWAVIIVPFGKWTHFLYRSFAMYFDAVKSKLQ